MSITAHKSKNNYKFLQKKGGFMKNLSLSSLAGICLIKGGVLAFIPFLFQILGSGPPEEGVHIFTDFAQNVVAGGKLALFYSISSAIGLSLVAYAIYTLNTILQKKEKHSVLGLGTFLFVFAQFGLIVAWAIDMSIVFGAETANIGNLFMIEMGLFFSFGTVGFIGGGLMSLALADYEFINKMFLKIVGYIFIVIGLIFIYTLFTFEYYSSNTILLLFSGVSIGQILSMIWQLLVGVKLVKTA